MEFDKDPHPGVCLACIKSKSKRQPFPRSNSHASRPLELVHTDVAVFTKPALDGSKYFLILLDDHTRKLWLINLKRKSEVTQYWENFVKFRENSTGHKVATLTCPIVLRSDNGGEYTSHLLDAFNKSKGITHQFTEAYTPEQNGRAE